MINPNRTHRIVNAKIESLNPTTESVTFRTKGTTFTGWVFKKGMQVGDIYTIYVQFSITCDRYVVDKANKKRVKNNTIATN